MRIFLHINAVILVNRHANINKKDKRKKKTIEKITIMSFLGTTIFNINKK